MSNPSLAPTTDSGTRTVLLGGLASGVAAYAFTILGARVLGEVAYAPVGVLWTLQYLVITVGLLSPEALATREGHIPPAVWAWVGVLAVGLATAGGLGGARLFGDGSPTWLLASALVAVGFSAFALARGLSASDRAFGDYAIMTGGESVVRLVVATAVVLVAPTPGALGLTLPVGAITMTLWWLVRRHRGRTPGGRVRPQPVVLPGTGRFLATTTTANAVAQVLLAGGPLLTASLGAPPELTSRVFVTTTAARAPLVLVYSGLLARLLAATLDLPAERLRGRVLAAAGAVVAATGVAAVAGGVLGPTLVAFAFGSGLRPSATFAALTGAAVALTIGLLAANQVLIAVRAADRLLLPWAAGMVAAGVLVAVDGGPADLRAGRATLAGLSVAAVVLLPRLLAAAGRPRTRWSGPEAL